MNSCLKDRLHLLSDFSFRMRTHYSQCTCERLHIAQRSRMDREQWIRMRNPRSELSGKHQNYEKNIRYRIEHDESRLSWRFEKCETVNVSLAVACSICAIVSTMFLTKLECALFDCLSKKQRRTAQLGVLEQQLFVRYRSGLLSCSFVLRTFDILG